MTYYPDLSPYTRRPYGGENVFNVGWLGVRHEYPTGEVSAEVVPILLELSLHAVVNRVRSWQRCELCEHPDYPTRMVFEGKEIALGDGEIRVTGRDGTVYAATSMIAHYVAEHSYLPPREFLEALLDTRDDDEG